MAYQEINGKRVEVAAAYTLLSNPQYVYGFKVGSYDKKETFIIDPLLASTFIGGSDDDYGYSIALDGGGNVYITGGTSSSDYPTTPGAYDESHNGERDVFVSKLDSDLSAAAPLPDIKANGSDGPITLDQSDTITIIVALDNKGRTENADWWLAADTPFGLFFFTFDGWTDTWVLGYQGPLFYLDSFEVLTMPVSGLPAGTYTLYFGVDTVMDGNVTWDSVYYDTVEVNITE